MTVQQELLSILEIYNAMKGGQFRFPAYQRGFVWNSNQQKQLIDSVLQGIYIGQILIAKVDAFAHFDIIDGQQRLKTISKFIENDFQIGQWKLTEAEQQSFLSQSLCVCFISQLTESDQAETLFQLLNTTGEPLTSHEIRRINGSGCFADTVSMLSSELLRSPDRRDDAPLLAHMWDRFHLFTEKEKIQGEDQVLISRLILAILFGNYQAQDNTVLDDVYRKNSSLSQKVEVLLKNYPVSDLISNLTTVFTALITSTTGTIHCTCEGFYIIFLALYDILIIQGKQLAHEISLNAIFDSIVPLIPQSGKKDLEYKSLAEYAKYRIQQQCVESPDEWETLEAVLRRTKIETAACEFKQGLLRLSEDRELEIPLKERILETLCGMANAHFMEPAYLFIGIADKETDAQRIAVLDHIQPIKASDHYIVGIEREAKVMGISVEGYCRQIKNWIDNSDLSKPLALSILSNIDIVPYRGFLLLRLSVLPQKEVSYFKNRIFIRKHSNTTLVTDPHEIVAIAKNFYD